MEDYLPTGTGDLAGSGAGLATPGLSSVVYRSRARREFDGLELARLISEARRLNVARGLSGLLLFDGTHFFQWLEGPRQVVESAWNSIRKDRRHGDIELLGRPELPVRLFRGWEMGLAGPSRSIAEGVEDVILVDERYFLQLENMTAGSIGPLVETLARIAPTESVLSTAPTPDEVSDHLRFLCLDHVLPLIHSDRNAPFETARYPRQQPDSPARIDPAFVQRFAHHLHTHDHGAAMRIWNRLEKLGVSPSALQSDLAEPVARRLGDLWADDRVSGGALAIAETELLQMMRRSDAPAAPASRPGQPRVLVTSPPGAFNLLGPALVARRMEALRCNAYCLFPETARQLDDELQSLDVSNVVIALDPVHAFSMESAQLDDIIHEAREAVGHHALRVMLYGRQVAVEPSLMRLAHADAAYASLAEFDLERLLADSQ